MKRSLITLMNTWLMAVGGWAMLAALCHGQTLYNFGNPTAEEQLHIELINRARAYPGAEGALLATTTDPSVSAAYTQYHVDLALMQSEFNALAAQPPVVPNASLTSTARSHSAWMLANAIMAHDETNPFNTLATRLAAANYPVANAGENVYPYAKSVWQCHAGFEVDWGYGSGGMQDPRGHRVNIHSPNFREIGVGVVFGANGPIGGNPAVGPQIVTQDFGTQSASPSFGTGVAYYDLNANNFYDVGEGIAGLTVNVNGATYACTTADGGGWVVPVPATATTRTVTFSGLNVNQSVPLVVPASKNAKSDLKLGYSPPLITSSASAAAGSLHTLTFAAVGGATGYKWTRTTFASATAENCESTANVTATTTGTYAVLNTAVKQQGTASLHLENPTGASQVIQLNGLYYGQSSPTLTFQSRICAATSDELFKVQVKDEGGSTWLDVDSQAGSNGFGASAFSQRSAALTAMTGKSFRVRFLLNFTSGSIFTITPPSLFGWFIDAISFSGVATLDNSASQNLTGTSGSFTPSAGTYLMSVTPVISGRDFPASSQTLTVTTKPSASVTLGSLAATYNGNPKAATATTSPAGLTVNLTYDGAPTAPTNAGSYTVLGTINDANYQGSTSGTLAISKSAATVTLGTLAATYNGSPKAATYITSPAGLSVDLTYDGAPTAPTNAGSYAVVGTINNANYQGNASGTLVISALPVILSQPVSTTISRNTSATLAVIASGGSLEYQWYEGTSGTETKPISDGTGTGSSFITPSLKQATSYWVRVTNKSGYINSITSNISITSGTVTRSFATWAAEIEVANNLSAGSVSTAPQDFDHDGRPNLIEYAFGTSPIVGNDPAPRLPVFSTTTTHHVMTYQRDTALTDLTLTAQAGTTLGTWTTPGGFTDTVVATSGTLETHEAKIPRTTGGSGFMRVRVTRP